MNARMTPDNTPQHQALRSELLENAAVLVVETTYPAGGSVPLHEHHFPHVLYVIEGGTLQTTAPDGNVTRLEVRPGQVFWRDAQSHSTRNLGSTPLRIVEVEIKDSTLRARCKTEEGSAAYEAELPVLVTLAQEANRPHLPGMVGLGKAAGMEIIRWTVQDLGLKPEEVGLPGSPTQMLNVFTPPLGRKGEILRGTPDELASRLMQKLHTEKILRGEVHS